MGIVLFENKKTCCGCSACASICPKGAIEMKPDDQVSFILLLIQICVFPVVHVKRYVHIKMKIHYMNLYGLMPQ